MIVRNIDRSRAKQAPEEVFESPLGIVEERMFTRGEKLATLDRWRQAILAQLAAQGETRRARLLGEIEEARVRLRGGGAA